MKKIGIICAMKIEADGFVNEMKNKEDVKVSGIPFTKGIIGNSEVVICVRGIGKVAAGMYAEAMIVAFSPDCIINTGVGGGLGTGLNVGDTVIASRLCQYDVDTTPVGDPLGMISGIDMIYLPTNEKLNAELTDAAKAAGFGLKSGVIATGDRFVSSDSDREFIKKNFGGEVCDMEGGAVAQVCYMNGVPCAVLRAISDSGDGNAVNDYPVFAAMAAKNAVKILLTYLNM